MKFLRTHGSLNVGALVPKSPGWLLASPSETVGFCRLKFVSKAWGVGDAWGGLTLVSINK